MTKAAVTNAVTNQEIIEKIQPIAEGDKSKIFAALRDLGLTVVGSSSSPNILAQLYNRRVITLSGYGKVGVMHLD